MPRIVYFDTDVVIKLAQYDLLQEACDALGVAPQETRVLAWAGKMLRHKLRKPDQAARMGCTAEGLRRAIDFAERATPIVDQPSAGTQSLLVQTEDVDPGEAVLFASVVESADDALVVTGDKRSLQAIADSPDLRDVYSCLAGRVTCLEALLQAVARGDGFSKLSASVARFPDTDRSAREAFLTGGSQQPQEEAIRRLSGTVARLTRRVGSNWLHIP